MPPSKRARKRQRALARSQERQKQLKLLLGGVVLLLLVSVVLGGVFILTQGEKRELSFEEAKNDISLRHTYIEQLGVQNGNILFRYNPVQRSDNAPANMDFAFVKPFTCSAPIKEEPTFVINFYSAFFDFTAKDDRDVIIKHEYRHVEQYRAQKVVGIPMSDLCTVDGKPNMPLLDNIGELDAIRSTGLSMFDQLSRELQKTSQDVYLDHYTLIWENSTGMDPKLISRIKIEFFESWMLTQFTERADASYTWEPNPNEKYPLSREEVTKIKQKLGGINRLKRFRNETFSFTLINIL